MRTYHRWLILFACVTVSGLILVSNIATAPAAEKPDAAPVSEKKAASPTIPDDLDYFPDQVYCIPDKDTKLMLDVLLPKTGKGPFPTVICLHGGGWVKGSRKTNLPLMIKLAQEGYAAVSVQYRLGSRFPAAVHDVKCAVRWLRANAAVFNLDAERFAALGYSSGGTMACLLGLTTPLDGLEGKGVFNGYPSDVQAVISYAGISDLAAWHKDGNLLARFSLASFMGESPKEAPKLYAQASPIGYARGDMAVVLMIHGTADPLVPIKQSEDMERRLKAAKGQVELLPIKDGGHILTGDAEKEADAAAVKFLNETFRSRGDEKAAKKNGR